MRENVMTAKHNMIYDFHYFPCLYSTVQLLSFATEWHHISWFCYRNQLYSKWGFDHLLTLWLYNAVTLTYFLCRTTCFKLLHLFEFLPPINHQQENWPTLCKVRKCVFWQWTILMYICHHILVITKNIVLFPLNI